MNIKETIDFYKVDDLINALLPNSKYWNYLTDSWIFRGQRDSTWGLIPSAFRKSSWDKFDTIVDSGNYSKWDNSLRLRFELNAVSLFSKIANRQGLPIPGFDYTWLEGDGISKKFSEDLDKVFFSKKPFPLPDWRQLFGMAQHYGIPTRLLDWSESSLVAAYFAASTAINHFEGNIENKKGKLAIWAICIGSIESVPFTTTQGKLRIITAPWDTNPNLRAQKGLFTTIDTELPPNKIQNYISIDKFIETYFNELPDPLKRNKPDTPKIYCFTLPIILSKELMGTLRTFEISAASIFPGYSSVTESVKELSFQRPIKVT